jgi:hypothetical protein
MATKYWVGGDGTWDASTTSNWADSSGGAGGAAAPTAADDVVFDAASNTLLLPFAVTIGAGAVCRDFSTGGAGGALDGVMTLAGSAAWTVHGSLTFPAANLSRTYTGTITFAATSTGKTITTNGVTLTGGAVIFDGVGGGWTLGSALTVTGNITLTNGAFATANFAVTAASLVSSNTNTRSLNLGSSAVTITSASTCLDFSTPTNFSLNSGTSTITCSGANPTFSGGGLTFYNVSFTTTGASLKTINGANTFNNFSVTSTTGTRSTRVFFGANQTISGTLTFGAANTSIRRIVVSSDVVGTSRTLTVAAVAALADVDFRDITATGASAPWSGTRLGNCLGNTGITFAAGVSKYWNLAAGGSWTSTAWALSSGGAVNVNNIPLAQDTAIFENTGLNAGATVAINNLYQVGTLDFSTRTLAMTFTSGALVIYKDVTLISAVTVNGTAALTFSGRPTQTVTSAGVSIGCPLTVNAVGVVSFADALTLANTLTFESGTIKLKNGATSTVTTFATSGTTQKFLQSTLAGSWATLSQASGTISASYLTIKDINAAGGAVWQAFTTNNNVDAGNNSGWDFSSQLGRYIYTRRKNKRLLP